MAEEGLGCECRNIGIGGGDVIRGGRMYRVD
jgi:hypothetical protein